MVQQSFYFYYEMFITNFWAVTGPIHAVLVLYIFLYILSIFHSFLLDRQLRPFQFSIRIFTRKGGRVSHPPCIHTVFTSASYYLDSLLEWSYIHTIHKAWPGCQGGRCPPPRQPAQATIHIYRWFLKIVWQKKSYVCSQFFALKIMNISH